MISQLMPPEFLLYMLNSKRLKMYEKRIFIELLQQLYINHYSLQLPQKSLMPEILLWRKAGAEKGIDSLKQEEKNKLFTHTIVKKIVPSEDNALIIIEEEDKLEDKIIPKSEEEKEVDALAKLVAGDIKIDTEEQTKQNLQKREGMLDRRLQKSGVI